MTASINTKFLIQNRHQRDPWANHDLWPLIELVQQAACEWQILFCLQIF